MHVVATAGHVDHGKSSLLRALTGMEPDRWEEERRRGLTIDLGFVWTDLAPDVTVAFVDVPGHERFAANMLAGVAAVRHALLVVAADDGWARQSDEHLAALAALGVTPVVAVVTKLGVAGADRAAEVADDVGTRLAADGFATTPVQVVDSIRGTGIDELRATLTDRLRAAASPRDDGRARLWVDRSFSIAGTGTVVTGTLAGGSIRTGDDVLVLPARRSARVRSIETLGEVVDRVAPEARVALGLAGIAREDVGRGDAVVAAAGTPGRALATAWRTTREFDAWVRPTRGEEVAVRGSWHVHIGTGDVAARLVSVGDDLDHGGPVRIALDRPLPLVTGDRFVLRDAGRRRVAAGGEVLDPHPPRVREAPPPAPPARAPSPPSPLRRATTARSHSIAASGGARPSGDLRAITGADPATGVTAVGDHAVVSAVLDGWVAGVTTAAMGDDVVVSRVALVDAAVASGAPRHLTPALIDHLVERGLLRAVGGGFALASRAGEADSAAATRRTTLLALLTRTPFAPPDLTEASRDAGVRHEELTRLVQRGDVVVCGSVGFAGAAVTLAIDRLVALEASVGRFTTAQARDALGTTRKYALPLLEQLDRIGVTSFDGQTRTVVRAPVR